KYQVEDISGYLEEHGLIINHEYNQNFGPILPVPNRTFIENAAELEAELQERHASLLAGTPAGLAEFEEWLSERQALPRSLPYQYEIALENNASVGLEPAPLKHADRIHLEIKRENGKSLNWSEFGLELEFGEEKRLVRWGEKLDAAGVKVIPQKGFGLHNKWHSLSIPVSKLSISPDAALTAVTFKIFTPKKGTNSVLIRKVNMDTQRYLTPLGQLTSSHQALLDQLLDAEADEAAATELRNIYYTDYAASPDMVALRTHHEILDDHLNGARQVPATVSGPLREVRVLNRGSWKDETGEIVQPATPHFLPGFEAEVAEEGEEQPQLTRLDLANWIVSKENPLTSRAFVNRVWAKFFGTALSNAPEDLGLQGEYPVYPELLDWLASEFMDSDWDVKHIVKTVVMSDAYRQSSVVTPALMELDPYNRLLARQTPRRLPAELIRDNALAASGLLVTRIGGPSVKPYQPDGHYQHLNFPRRTYDEDMNENQYRRGVYMHWQRTFLHPMLVAFDAPGRDECSVSRTQSNTPLQALNLLNDPTFVEAAKAMASRVLQSEEIAAEDAPRIRHAIKLALARKASDAEVEQLQAFLERERARFVADPAAADQLLYTGMYQSGFTLDNNELAAWTSLCRAIFNLHETITRY
ncbi:MAG: DUF1553 domain-containing protein, partial [Verrucomicrobiota bacterium]